MDEGNTARGPDPTMNMALQPANPDERPTSLKLDLESLLEERAIRAGVRDAYRRKDAAIPKRPFSQRLHALVLRKSYRAGKEVLFGSHS